MKTITFRVILKNTTEILPYDYYNKMHGYICKLLGNDFYGKDYRNYVYSNICNGRCTKQGFKFVDNPYFYVRVDSEKLRGVFYKNIVRIPIILGRNKFYVEGVEIIEEDLSEKVYFDTDAASPIIAPKKFKGDYLSIDDLKICEESFVAQVKRRGNEMDIDIDPTLSIEVVKQRPHRDILMHGIINKGRNLLLKISANDETKKFIMDNGIGRSTSCGFGFLK